ncbi:MAG: hypothetical protein H3C34_06685, partial [Caldilineaceae bacterium]|nr:hypothetical protein [Caldilineaceae bacterium]
MAGLTGPAPQTANHRRRQLKVLLQLRARLALRQFMREPGQLAGILVMLLVFGPLVIGLAFGTALGYRVLAAPAQILGIVLCGLWLLWMVLPLLSFRTNEGLDLSRLLLYPLHTRDLLVSMIVGSLLDAPTYLTLPFFVAMVVGWAGSPALVVLLVAMVLGYLLMLVSGQLVLTASMGLLRSRRFRDISIIVVSLLGSSCYLLSRVTNEVGEAVAAQGLEHFRPLAALQWLPPGAGARAVELAMAGDWLQAGLWLLYSTAWLVVLTWAWWRLLVRITTGVAIWQPAPANRRKPARHEPAPGAGAGERLLAWLPPQVRAILFKEFILIWRVPQRRISLFQSVFVPVVFVVAFLFNEGANMRAAPSWFGLALPVVGLFVAWGIGANMLGMESRGLSVLLLTPADRRQLLIGKGLAAWFVALAPTTIYGAALFYFTHEPLVLYGWLAAITTTLATTGVNIVASVLFPYPFDENSVTRRRSGGGCSAGLGQVLVVPMAMVLAALPTAAPGVLGYWLGHPEIYI